MNKFRFTKDVAGAISISVADSGKEGKLTRQAAHIIDDILAGGTRKSNAIAKHASFLKRCKDYGWLDSNFQLNGTYREVPAGPRLSRIQVELSVKCNFACDYCYSESGPTQAAALTVEEVKGVLRSADQIGVTWVDFTGGEVLIYKGWQEVIDFARSLGMVVSVHTNGLLLTERNVSFLADMNIRNLQVTVESHHAEVHASVGRGNVNSHRRVLEGIRRATDAGINVRLAALVHRKNIDHIAESVSWFHQQFGAMIALDRVMATGVEGASDLAVTEEEFWSVIAPLIGTGEASNSRICEPMATPAGASTEPECGVAHSFVYLTADGRYSLCPTMTHREESQFMGPSVRDMSLADAWSNSELFNRFRGLNCENVAVCPASGVCGGGCRSNAYIATGRLTAPDVISCNTFKNPNKTYVDFLGRYADGLFTPVDVSK